MPRQNLRTSCNEVPGFQKVVTKYVNKIMVCKANFVTPATIYLHRYALCRRKELYIVYYKSFQINSKRFCNLMPQNKLPTCVYVESRDGQQFFARFYSVSNFASQ